MTGLDDQGPRSRTVLLLIDVINDMDFERGPALKRAALPVARKLAALKQRLLQARVPILYVNDNFGRWRSAFSEQVEYCLEPEVPGRDIVALLHPSQQDYFVLKPKHSGFYETCLDVLLRKLGAERLILGGFATDICVTATAYDAHQRGYTMSVLSDGCAAETPERHRTALLQMRRSLGVEVTTCGKLEVPGRSTAKRAAPRRTRHSHK